MYFKIEFKPFNLFSSSLLLEFLFLKFFIFLSRFQAFPMCSYKLRCLIFLLHLSFIIFPFQSISFFFFSHSFLFHSQLTNMISQHFQCFFILLKSLSFPFKSSSTFNHFIIIRFNFIFNLSSLQLLFLNQPFSLLFFIFSTQITNFLQKFLNLLTKLTKLLYIVLFSLSLSIFSCFLNLFNLIISIFSNFFYLSF